MTLAKVVFASMTGNAEGIADIAVKALEAAGIEVEENECTEVSASDFESADICIVSTYTWGEGEVPDELLDFHDELEDVDLSGKVFGVLGTGDTSHDHFCRGAEEMEAAFEKTGAKKGAELVKIENEAGDEDEERIQKFVEAIVASI